LKLTNQTKTKTLPNGPSDRRARQQAPSTKK
jgi:hypothetical protein